MDDRDEIESGSTLTDAELAAARKFVLEKPSPSYLQRKMQIGYNHAVRIVEYFEAEGLVSPPNSAGLRTVRPINGRAPKGAHS